MTSTVTPGIFGFSYADMLTSVTEVGSKLPTPKGILFSWLITRFTQPSPKKSPSVEENSLEWRAVVRTKAFSAESPSITFSFAFGMPFEKSGTVVS